MLKRARLWIAGGALGLTLAVLVPIVDAALSPAARMASAADAFLGSLSAEQRTKATFTIDDAHRTEWFYVPIARKGVPLKQLTPAQRERAHAFLKTGLSPAGYTKTAQIIELEKVLAELEKNPVKRDHELYYFSVFGKPAAKGSWGWRVEGHHMSLNFTVVNGSLIATTPIFLGANPGEVRQGPLKGRRVLRAEEDLGRELVSSLDEKQRAVAVIAKDAPAEVLTTNQPKVEPLSPAGLAAAAMTPKQTALLRKLLGEYAALMPAELAKERLAKLEKAGFEKIHFAWAGKMEPGVGHYYRVQGPTFLIEYDNTQNEANHVHTVWRDFEGDFGRDLLREHLKAAHAP